MEDPSRQPTSPSGPSSPLGIYWIALLLALIITGAGAYIVFQKGGPWTLFAAGSAGVLGVMLTWPLAHLLNAIRCTQLKDLDAQLTNLHERLEQFSVLITLMSEQQLISDRVKSVVFREKERDSLRRAIEEEISRQDWEAAMALVNDIERTFGYKAEADRFRGQINARHNDVIRKQINEAVTGIDRHIRAENWQIAIREAERLQQAYPADEQVSRLPRDIEDRRINHKKQLMESWKDALIRHDNDGAIEILKKLDMYLTPDEATSMQESARHVFKEKLANLRTRFTVAYQDERFNEAIRIAEEIMSEFPNSKMSDELRETIPALRLKAGQEAAEPART